MLTLCQSAVTGAAGLQGGEAQGVSFLPLGASTNANDTDMLRPRRSVNRDTNTALENQNTAINVDFTALQESKQKLPHVCFLHSHLKCSLRMSIFLRNNTSYFILLVIDAFSVIVMRAYFYS